MMEEAHLINSIYRATEGEGIYLGRPQIFVRYQGCAVACLNCDSKDTWDFDKKKSFSLSEILEKISEEGFRGSIKNISITGGDPLHPLHTPQVINLIKALKEKKYYINIEAAGTRIVHEIFDLLDFISFDYKTPSTGVQTSLANLQKMNREYPQKFQIKSVIQDWNDFESALDAYKKLCTLEANLNFSWVLTPSYNTNEEFPLERFVSILKWNEENGGFFRVIGQQHKWVYGPNQKQV